MICLLSAVKNQVATRFAMILFASFVILWSTFDGTSRASEPVQRNLECAASNENDNESLPNGGDDRAEMRVLFAGSSSTYWNDMPNEVAKIISGQQGLVNGKAVTAELVGRSGSDIRVYLDPNCDYQYGVKPGQSFLDKIRDEPFDYVVLMTVCRFIMGDGENTSDGQLPRSFHVWPHLEPIRKPLAALALATVSLGFRIGS